MTIMLVNVCVKLAANYSPSNLFSPSNGSSGQNVCGGFAGDRVTDKVLKELNKSLNCSNDLKIGIIRVTKQ